MQVTVGLPTPPIQITSRQHVGGLGGAMSDTESILQATLDVIRRDGWKPNGWALVPPYCLRAALTTVVNRSTPIGRERDEANKAAREAIAAALGQPLGLISYYESQPGRTQQDIEAVLEKAIAGLP
ncbi:DUF6197 family protein [Mycobacterium kansasii]